MSYEISNSCLALSVMNLCNIMRDLITDGTQILQADTSSCLFWGEKKYDGK